MRQRNCWQQTQRFVISGLACLALANSVSAMVAVQTAPTPAPPPKYVPPPNPYVPPTPYTPPPRYIAPPTPYVPTPYVPPLPKVVPPTPHYVPTPRMEPIKPYVPAPMPMVGPPAPTAPKAERRTADTSNTVYSFMTPFIWTFEIFLLLCGLIGSGYLFKRLKPRTYRTR